jgi:chitosanase
MQASFTCPQCGRTSYNPNDVREGYCGWCHDYTRADTELARLRAELQEQETKMSASPFVPFDPKLVDFIRRILSVAETDKAEWDPSAVYVYADDNRFKPARKQVTLSIGFTEGGSNLRKVLQRYVDKGGALSASFAGYLPTIGSGPSLANDMHFIGLLKAAGKEPAMAQAQKECFDEFYLGPAFAWAKKFGFTQPLSFLVIADSYLHSGSMLGFLMERFAEKKPVDGGDEKAWIKAYLDARKNWLATHNNSILRGTVYRANCYIAEGERDNWELAQSPVNMHGTEVV